MILHSTGTLAKTGFEDVTKQISITDLRQGTYIIDIQPDNYSNKIMFVKKWSGMLTNYFYKTLPNYGKYFFMNSNLNYVQNGKH